MTEFEKFKNIAILKGISDEQARALFVNCRRCLFEKGDLVMEEGEEKHSMFFFIEGEVVVSNVITMKVGGPMGYSEVEKSLVRCNAEQVGVLGEMSVFEDQPRSATVKAYESSVLYEIDKKDFEDFVFKHPEIGINVLYNIARELSTRIRRSNRDILKLTTALSK